MTRKTRWSLGLVEIFTIVVASIIAVAPGCKREKSQTTANKEGEQEMMLEKGSGGTPAGRSADVVVEVNGRQLTREGLESQIDRFMASQNLGNLPPQALEQARGYLAGQVVQRFVTESVLLQEAERQKIKVEEAELAKTLDEIKAGLPEGVTLGQALARFGATEQSLRSEIEQDLKIRALVDRQISSNAVEVTQAEVEAFYREQPQFFEVPENVRVRHILVECATNASETVVAEKKAKAEGLRKQLLEGTNFAELAASSSDCPSRQKGGDLGTLTRGQVVKEFEDAAFVQATNEIGPVVKTRFGYHIIQVMEHNQASKRRLDEVREQITSYLTNRKQQELLAAYIGQLKAKVKIKYGAGFQPPAEESGLEE